MFAASMSTLDSLALALSASIARDVHAKLDPKATPGTLINVARLTTFGVLIVGALIGFFWSGVESIVILQLLGGSLRAIIYPLVIAAIFWRRATKEGAVAGMITGAIVGIKMLVVGPRVDPWIGLFGGIWAMLASLVAMVVVSLLTKPTRKEILDEMREALMVHRRKTVVPAGVKVAT
jgi:Na+/proline symporter